MKKVYIIVLSIIVTLIVMFNLFMLSNRAYFKTTYIGNNNQKIYIPRFSYFEGECCMTSATFYSFVPKPILENHIDNYLSDFEYKTTDETYGYYKGTLFIQSYEVEEHYLYRKIIIVY
ncbi:MAG: hypothetical protein WC343_04115 [Bacilli bacterium]|jgi:hypothetical protein